MRRPPPLREVRRVLVAGMTGVGKSTLARRLSALWDLPYAELDTLHHGPGWTVQTGAERATRHGRAAPSSPCRPSHRIGP